MPYREMGRAPDDDRNKAPETEPLPQPVGPRWTGRHTIWKGAGIALFAASIVIRIAGARETLGPAFLAVVGVWIFLGGLGNVLFDAPPDVVSTSAASPASRARRHGWGEMMFGLLLTSSSLLYWACR